MRRRTPPERAIYRAQRFATYFAEANTLSLSANNLLILAPPTRRYRFHPHHTADLWNPNVLQTSGLGGLLIGLNNAEDKTLALGLLEGVTDDGREVCVKTPLKNPSGIRILQLGSLRLNQQGHELDKIE